MKLALTIVGTPLLIGRVADALRVRPVEVRAETTTSWAEIGEPVGPTSQLG